MTVYEREFILQAAHFNGPAQYDDVAAAHIAAARGDHEEAFALMRSVAQSCHGHEFKVVCMCTADSDLVVDDDALAAVVNEWNNTNLSLHPDFTGRRATTEAMARVLHEKITSRLGVMVAVEVHETPHIRARFPS